MHTLPLVGVLLDNYVSYKSYGSSLVRNYIPLLVASIGYTSWIIIVKYYTSVWAYAVFDLMDNSQIAIFVAVLYIIMGFLFIGGYHLNSLLWKKEISLKTRKIA